MKKIYAIIAVMAVVSVFAMAGCQKQEAPKPAEQTAVTSTAPVSAETSTAPAAAPAAK